MSIGSVAVRMWQFKKIRKFKKILDNLQQLSRLSRLRVKILSILNVKKLISVGIFVNWKRRDAEVGV